MDKMVLYLYNTDIVDYFRGLHFLHWISKEDYVHTGDRSSMDYYTLQYLISGKIWLQVDDNPNKILTGPTVWMTFPESRFRYGNVNGYHWNHSYVAFKGPRADMFVQNGLLPIFMSPSAISLKNDSEFSGKFRSLITLLDQGKWDWGTHLLEGLLLEIHSPVMDLKPENSLDRNLQDLVRRISAHPEAEWDFHKIALNLNITHDHFRHRCKEVCGESPVRLLNSERLKKGSSLLRSTDYPVKKVASMVGIDDVYYFTKLFKRQYHLPPGRYREEFGEF